MGMALTSSPMEMYMLESIQVANLRDMANTHGLTVVFMQGSSRMVSNMVKVDGVEAKKTVRINTKANTKTIKRMGLVSLPGLPEIHTKVHIIMMKEKDME
jgi:hypothetical protein